MGKRLLQAFAVEDPDRFAQLLGATHDVGEAVEILNEIPDGAEAEVLSRLGPEAAERLLGALSDDMLGAWLAACPTDVGRRLLSRVGQQRSTRLISRIEDPSKRRGLRRIASYPADSIGAKMHFGVLTISEAATVSEVERVFQEQQAGSECPAVIIGADRRVAGVLDLVAFVRNRDDEACAGEFCIRVPPVHADSPLSSLLMREEWRQLTGLPVVDFENKLVGYVTRADLVSAARKFRPANVFLESSVELSARFLQFLAYMMVLIISRREDH